MNNTGLAEALMRRDLKGGYVVPVRLNKRMKQILLEMIKEEREETSYRFSEDDEIGLGHFLSTMQWLEAKLTGKAKIKIRFNVIIAERLWNFTLGKEFHPLSGSDDFNLALQWVTNQWNTKYSLTKMTTLADNKIRAERNGN